MYTSVMLLRPLPPLSRLVYSLFISLLTGKLLLCDKIFLVFTSICSNSCFVHFIIPNVGVKTGMVNILWAMTLFYLSIIQMTKFYGFISCIPLLPFLYLIHYRQCSHLDLSIYNIGYWLAWFHQELEIFLMIFGYPFQYSGRHIYHFRIAY